VSSCCWCRSWTGNPPGPAAGYPAPARGRPRTAAARPRVVRPAHAA
jgi:hypothetical protein